MLLAEVFDALETLGAEPESTKAQGAPAVPVNKSVADDHLVCLECGHKFKSLKRHLKTSHGLSPDEYRERWGLPSSYPMVAPGYAKTRSALAKSFGLGRKAKS